MGVKISVTEGYKNFGRTVHLENGFAEAHISLDIGPRILHFSLPGGRNIMFNDVNRDICNEGPEYDAVFGPDTRWYIYGGHRLWTSPEHLPRSYYPDNVPVAFEQTEAGGVFTQTPQVENGIQLSVEVRMGAGPELEVVHKVVNTGGEAVTLAPWALTVLAPGGVQIIPQNTTDTEILANRVMSVWPYTDMGDPRVRFGDRYIILRQDPAVERPFKIGLDNEAGTAVYVLEDTVFVKKYPHVKDAEYPDFGVSFETYTNKHFLEMESLGVLETLAPGAQAVHTERWSVLQKQGGLDTGDEASVADFMKRHV